MSPTTQASVDTFWHRSILICFHFLLLATPLFFTWFNDELFEFNKMILTYAVTVVVGSLWVGRMISEKQLFVRRTIFDLPIAVFFLSQVVSTIFSINQHTSFLGYYSRSNGGLVSFFCYITLFYAFISNLQKRDLPKLFFSTFLSAFLVSLIAIPEHFGHSLSCLMINVYRYRGQALPSGWFGQFYDVSCWIQDVQTRVYATFGQPNWLAAYAILLIPIGTVLSVTDQFALKVRNSTLPVRLFYGVSTLSLLLSLVFTKSRSGILGLALGMLVLVLGFGSVWFRDFHHRKMTLIFAGACMIAILFFGTPFSKNYGEQWLSQHPEVKQQEESPVAPPTTPNRLDIGGTDSGEIRQIVWSGALKVWQRYPLFGSGVETFAYSYYKDRPVEHNLVSEWDFLYNKAHNEFLNFLATTGLFGLATYVVMVSTFTLFPLWSVWRKGKEEKADQQHPADRILFSSALASGLLALSISNFFGFSTVMVNVLLFLLPAFFVVKYLPLQMKTWSFAEEEPQEDGEPTKNTEEDTSRILAVISYVILFCVAAGLLFSVYSLWRADYLYTRGKQYIQLSKANEGLRDLQAAVQISPGEPTFYDDLSSAYSRVAISLAQQGSATASAQFASEAIRTADSMIQLNPANVNLYKSQARVYMNLAQMEPQLLLNAKASLQKAIDLSPTDPKLYYLLGLVELSLEDNTAGVAHLEKAVALKPDYEVARLSLGEQYQKAGLKERALGQYRYILENIQPDQDEAKRRIASLSAQVAVPSSTLKSK